VYLGFCLVLQQLFS